MEILKRLLARMRFRKSIKSDESTNVVDGIVKARKLYKKLCLAAHPDKHLAKRDVAEDLTQRITANKHNYAALVALKKEIEETLK